MQTATLEDSLAVSYKTKYALTMRSSNQALRIYPNELKMNVHTKACMWMFIAALFVIAKAWKQSRCPSVGEWINKLRYIQTMEYYSVFERNDLSRSEKMWRNLKSTLLSERSRSEKAVYCRIPTTWHSGKGTTVETAETGVRQALEGREG